MVILLVNRLVILEIYALAEHIVSSHQFEVTYHHTIGFL